MPPPTASPIPEAPAAPVEVRASRRKWKTRSLMAAVAVAALAFWLVIPAYRIALDRDWHLHTRLVTSPDRREWFLGVVPGESPFWPRYVRHLSGRPWRGRPLCGLADHAGLPFQEECEHAHPGIVGRLPDGSLATVRLSPAQRAEFDQIKARDPGAVAFGLNRKPLP